MNKNWLQVEMKADKTAHLKIHGAIGGGFFEEGATAEQVERDLEAIANLQANKIIVDLHSLGGSVDHGLKMYNMLKQNSASIEVDITGWTASIGTVIAMAADKGKLRMVNNSQFLVHEARTGVIGTASTLKSMTKTLDAINEDIANIYAERIEGVNRKQALALMSINGGEGEFWSSKETLSKGFIDKTYKPTKGMATASVSQEDLKEFKIKAIINKTKVMKFDIKAIAKYALNAVTLGMVKMSDEDKSTENIENLVNEATKLAVEAVQPQIDEALKAKEDRIKELEAELVTAKATGTDPVAGNDPQPNGDSPVVTEAKAAMNEFMDNLSDTDKRLMTKKDEENNK